MRSLQGRLGFQLLLALLAVFLLLWVVVSSAIRNVAEDYIATRLEHDSETLLSALNFDAQGQPVIDSARVDSIYDRPFSGHYYQIFTGGQVLTSRSLWDQQMFTSLPQETRLHSIGPQQQPLLVVVRHYRKQTHSLAIVVAEDLTALEADIKVFQNRFTLTAILILLALIVLSILSVKTGLKPLQRVRNEIVDLEQGERQQLSEDVPSEVAPLVSEVNRLLMLLSNRLQRSRHALGDLAHTLKKPLTILQQLEREEAIQTDAETHQTLITQVSNMQQIIERQLRRARLAGEGHAGIHFHVTREIPELVEVLEKIYQEKSLRIETILPQQDVINLDREDMLELLGNLLDNACKWTRRRVLLTLKITDTLQINIEDDGEGVAEDALGELSGRGKRLDESVTGHGLGLAIVKDIVDHYQGRIRFSRSGKLGGLKVEISLPLISR